MPSAESRAALDRVAASYPLVVVNSLADLTSGLQSEVSQLVALFGGLIAEGSRPATSTSAALLSPASEPAR